MCTDPSFLNRFPIQTRFDIPSSSPQPPLSSNTSPPLPSFRFQYASCPHCRSQRARLTKYTKEDKTFFSIDCPYCGYNDDDVCDY